MRKSALARPPRPYTRRRPCRMPSASAAAPRWPPPPPRPRPLVPGGPDRVAGRHTWGRSGRATGARQQALLVLAYLRKGETYAELAAGFSVGTATAWRYVTKTVALLAARSPRLRRALDQARQAGHAYVIIDGTLVLMDRVAAERPFYSGRHRRHGMTSRSSPAPTGTSCGCPAVARRRPRPDRGPDLGHRAELAVSGLVVLADKGYGCADEHIRTPYKGRNKPASQKEANRAHARLRGPGERANAQLSPGASYASSVAAPGKPGGWPRQSTFFKPAKSEDEIRLRVRTSENAAMRTVPASDPLRAEHRQSVPRPARRRQVSQAFVLGDLHCSSRSWPYMRMHRLA